MKRSGAGADAYDRRRVVAVWQYPIHTDFIRADFIAIESSSIPRAVKGSHADSENVQRQLAQPPTGRNNARA